MPQGRSDYAAGGRITHPRVVDVHRCGLVGAGPVTCRRDVRWSGRLSSSSKTGATGALPWSPCFFRLQSVRSMAPRSRTHHDQQAIHQPRYAVAGTIYRLRVRRCPPTRTGDVPAPRPIPMRPSRTLRAGESLRQGRGDRGRADGRELFGSREGREDREETRRTATAFFSFAILRALRGPSRSSREPKAYPLKRTSAAAR